MTDPYVLVGVDDRPDAVAAARFGLREAADRGLALVLAYGYAPLPVRPAAPGGPELDRRRRAMKAVLDAAAGLVAPAAMSIETVVEDAPPLDLLTRLGRNADLIVLGRHHLGIRERVQDPSLGSRLVDRVRCPVVVVPADAGREPAARSPVVVALDGETAAVEALELAFDEAERRRRMILALHAGPLTALPARCAAEERDVAEILAGWKADHPDVVVRTLICPAEPTELIVQASRDAALMVIGRPHAAAGGGWSRSVAAAVLTLAHCPLAIAPAADQVPTAV